MRSYLKFDNYVKIIFLLLLVNVSFFFFLNSWLVTESPILNPIFKNTSFLCAYFLAMIICFIVLLKEKITSFSLSLKDGFSAKLQQIQKEKEEIRNLAIDMLESHVTIIENSKRWGGWSEKCYQKAMEKIQEKCKKFSCKDDEQNRIFQTKLFWENVDPPMWIRYPLFVNKRGLKQLKKI